MKRIFENVGGNQFKLLTENTELKESVVGSGIKKVFSNGEKRVSYEQIESIGVGVGFIKEITGARRHALQEARKIAEDYNYSDDSSNKMFVKKEVDAGHSETDMSNPEERREVQIGKEILLVIDSPGMDRAMESEKGKLRKLAEELIQMHGVE